MVEDGKDCVRWLPYLMLSYRKVPWGASGYSPFELLHSSQLSTPNQRWSSSMFLDGLENRIHVEPQGRQKRCIDKKGLVFSNQAKRSCNSCLHQGIGYRSVGRVPLRSSKIGPSTYEIDIHHQHRRRKQAFHVNLLKEWHSSVDPVSQEL